MSAVTLTDPIASAVTLLERARQSGRRELTSAVRALHSAVEDYREALRDGAAAGSLAEIVRQRTADLERLVYAAVWEGWDAYRRSQEIPFPAVGGLEVLKAQSRLFRLAEPYASGREEIAGADLDAIEKARGDLAEVVRRCCGPEAAAHIGGEDKAAAA